MHNIHTWNVLVSNQIHIFMMSSYFSYFICEWIYSTPIFKLTKIMQFFLHVLFLFQIRTPSKRYLSKPPLWYKEPLFLVALAAVSIVIIIVVVAILCVKSKSYKYKGNYHTPIIKTIQLYDTTKYNAIFISFLTTNGV